MRGQKTFNDIIKDDGLTETQVKGRSSTLVMKRNECLAARYYFYARAKRRCYEEILRLLASEFFLSPNTISQIVQDNIEQIKFLKQKPRTQYFFQSRWPHLKW